MAFDVTAPARAENANHVVVIGAGIGGLSAAARLAAAGAAVTVLERHSAPGGKLRSLPSAAGPVAAGPTVLTLRGVFDELFAALGTRLEDHVTLIRQTVQARHFWRDGARLDLHDDPEMTVAAIAEFAGSRAAGQFRAFADRARRLFEGFEGPMLRTSTPTFAALARHVARNPGLVRPMAPLSSLAGLLARSFDDPRLVQLFGRYATYVGGVPGRMPALIALVRHAEASGVWAVEGGMERLAAAICDLARAHGARMIFDAHVDRIETSGGAATGVILSGGARLPADRVLFNGDPRALATGALGAACTGVAARTRRLARSLSADVWAFAAQAEGPAAPALAHHNVFFRDDPAPEFAALDRGMRAEDPTLYVCAMDRGLPDPAPRTERVEIIANAPALTVAPDAEEAETCRRRIFTALARHGLNFTPAPEVTALTGPREFEAMFPASAGALYGQSPHGMMAPFRRPTTRTAIAGLYLAGGGAHPGPGVPIAALSGRHAAEAILSDRISTSPSRPAATPGGMSTGSAMRAGGPSASSDS